MFTSLSTEQSNVEITPRIIFWQHSKGKHCL